MLSLPIPGIGISPLLGIGDVVSAFVVGGVAALGLSIRRVLAGLTVGLLFTWLVYFFCVCLSRLAADRSNDGFGAGSQCAASIQRFGKCCIVHHRWTRMPALSLGPG